MKILHITDSHGTVKGPESRRDVYYISFLKKLYELGFVIKKNNIDLVVHTGDLFHTARVSDKFAGQVSEMIKAMGVPFYVVPGNHDIEGYTTDTIDQTKLGLLAKAGVITILDRDNPIRVTANQNGEEYSVAISGQEYYAHIDEGNQADFEMQQDDADLNILAIHGYLTSTPQHPDIKCTMTTDVVTDADIILTGHYHRAFEWNGPDVDIYNPGSMMRVEQTDYNKTRVPQYGILDIWLDSAGRIDYKYDFHDFRIAQPSTVIFDYNAKYKAKATSISLDGFKNSISNTMSSVSPSMGIDKIIDDLCIQGNVESELHKLALKIYHDTLQSVPDEFEVQQGFIEAQRTRKIVKVELHNFQSHEDTVVDFSSGLNIIIGESNNGKTSIMRAIMWVIDNQPLGTDFIMAGKDDCWVKVTYDDGSFIERGRTIKDTGYYKVQFKDENGNIHGAEYRGFTNAVPVEVANIHQMPKVSITKDIETHLNVLSQLDGPFLLTESPLVKASAIGRITGTHIIDAAIKESNKTIQSNRKLIKNYEQELAEKEAELKALPDINIMSSFSDAYSFIIAYIKQLSDSIQKIEQYIQDVQTYNVSIAQNEAKYVQYKIITDIRPILSVAINTFDKVDFLQPRVDDYCNTNIEIHNQEQIIQQTIGFTLLKPIVRKAIELYEFTDKLRLRQVSCDSLSNQIETTNENIRKGKEYLAVLNSVRIHCQLLYDYNIRMVPKVAQITELEAQQDEAVQNIAGIKRTIKGIEKQIKQTQKEKNSFILDNGICPCCGQKVEESHISAITTFMEGL